jgi:hypothetical protein
MIDVRARAEFKADFPDDGVDDGFGYTIFPGKNVAAAIAEMLRGIGCAVAGPLNADEHGWELIVEFQKERMDCQITWLDADDCILLFTDGVFMGNSSSNPAYLEAITKLNLEMQRDPRFHEICWFRWREPQGPGASTPLDVGLDQLPRPVPRSPRFAWWAKRASKPN